VVYEGTRFEMGFRADLVVQNSVIVEIKSIAEITLYTKSNYSRICGWPTSAMVR
jgi:GxxExxY protein